MGEVVDLPTKDADDLLRKQTGKYDCVAIIGFRDGEPELTAIVDSPAQLVWLMEKGRAVALEAS